jgi:hypothetical protein
MIRNLKTRNIALLLTIILVATFAAAQVTFSGTFYSTSGPAAGVISGDFNRDGRPDIAVANGQGDTDSKITVFLGTGGGHFGAGVDHPLPIPFPTKVLTTDLNGDGVLDLIVSYDSSNILSTLLGNGDGTFRPGADLVATYTVRDFDLGDFNHNGTVDAALIECSTGSASCDMQAEMNNGSGSFTPGWKIQMTSMDAHSISARDMDGDGNLDLILIRTTDVLIFGSNSIGEFRTFTKFTPPAHCTDPNVCTDGLSSVVVGDFNNDAKLDFAVEQAHSCGSACGDNTVYVYKNVGSAGVFSFSRVSQFTIGPMAGGFLTAADLNGDQNIDLINSNQAHQGGGNVYVAGNGNNTFGAPHDLPGGDIADFRVRDLNLDSRHDLYMGEHVAFGLGVDLNTNAITNCAPPNSANLAAKLCGPANNASVASPVLVKASGNSPAGILRLEIWIDGHKQYQKYNDQVAKRFTLAAGSHRITVVAVDMYKGTAKTSVTVNVQ